MSILRQVSLGIAFFLAISCHLNAQDGCFSLDSIPNNQFIRFVYSPADSTEVPHGIDIVHDERYEGYLAIYVVPYIWVGVEYDGLAYRYLDEDLSRLVNQMFCLADSLGMSSKKPHRQNSGKYTMKRGFGNVGPDSLWQKAYLHFEEICFGDQIRNALNLQRLQIANLAKRIPGCYSVSGRNRISLLDEELKLKRIESSVASDINKCFWCFLRDRVVMSGPCYLGAELTYGWELRQGAGEEYLCLYPLDEQFKKEKVCSYEFGINKMRPEKLLLETRENPIRNKYYPPGIYEMPAILPKSGYNALDQGQGQ